MRIFDDHQHWSLVRQSHELRHQRFQRCLPSLLRRQFQRGIASVIRERQHLGKECGILRRGRSLREHRIELVELGLRFVVVGQPGGAFHLADDRIKRTVGMLRGAEIAQPCVRLAGDAFQERGREPRFADAGLAGHQHHLALAGLCLGPAPQQKFEFLFPPDEGGQSGRVKGVKAALDGTRAQRRPGPHRPGDALEVLGPEIAELEEIAEKPARALGYDDHVRFGQRLQARRQVRRLADDSALLRLARSDQIADDDEAGRDADADLQGNARGGLQLRHRLGERQPRLHRAFGVMFVRLRIAEIGQHPVAHIFGDEPAGLRDQVGAEPVIGAHDLAHILWIESRRHRGRPDEVAEHHGELPAFGDVRKCLKRHGVCRFRRSFRRTQTCNRLKQALAMPKGHAKFFEVAVRQLTQNLGVDVILAK